MISVGGSQDGVGPLPLNGSDIINDSGQLIGPSTVTDAIDWIYNSQRNCVRNLGMAQMQHLAMSSVPLPGEQIILAGVKYEFNASTPPVGGSPDAILVYNSAFPVMSLNNLGDAIRCVDFPAGNLAINYNGQTPPDWTTRMVTAPDMWIQSSVSPGSAGARYTSIPEQTEHTLTAVGDGFDAEWSYGGADDVPEQEAVIVITPTAIMETNGFKLYTDFDSVRAVDVSYPEEPIGVRSVVTTSGPSNSVIEFAAVVAPMGKRNIRIRGQR